MEWTWLVRISPDYQEAESSAPRMVGVYAPAAAAVTALLAIVLPSAGGVPWWWLPAVYAVHVTMVISGLKRFGVYARHPVAYSTIVAATNLTLCASLAAFADAFVAPLWTFFLLYVLIGARAFPLSVLFAALVFLEPLAIAVGSRLLRAQPLDVLPTPHIVVAAMGVAAYVTTAVLVGNQRGAAKERQEALRLEAAARERTRIAAELHDTIGSGLAEIALWLDVVERGNPEGVGRAKGRTRAALGELRVLVDALAEKPIDSARAEALLRERLDGLCAAATVALSIVVDGTAAVHGTVAHHVLKIVEEATVNAIRHAAPRNIAVHVAWTIPPRVEVSDDGRGFDPTVGTGMGIASMRDRAMQLGQVLRIASGASGDRVGTRVCLEARSETV